MKTSILEDSNEVLWALTTRFQPATDMYVIPRSITSSLEPSAGADGLTSKLMLDLTMKENFRARWRSPPSKCGERFATLEGICCQIENRSSRMLKKRSECFDKLACADFSQGISEISPLVLPVEGHKRVFQQAARHSNRQML
jgi:3-polyprenyl-4-hydroxybenzoate decarboxylase